MPQLPNLTQTNLGAPGQLNGLPSTSQPQNFNQPLPRSTSPANVSGDPSQSLPWQNLAPNGANGDKGPDYVYFERKPQALPTPVQEKGMAAKMRLELYYKDAVEGVVQRKERCASLRTT